MQRKGKRIGESISKMSSESTRESTSKNKSKKCSTLCWWFCLLVSFILETTIKAASSDGEGGLPLCIEKNEDIDNVRKALSNRGSVLNKDKGKDRFTDKYTDQYTDKYKIYKELLAKSSDAELLARLVYAETLAAQCKNNEELVGSLILEVIFNRVQRREGRIKTVIFEKNQFASSLNVYRSSRFRDFLCPKNPILWKILEKKTDDLLEGERVLKTDPQTDYQTDPLIESNFNKQKETGFKNQRRLSAETFHYFLYQHDPRWKKEPASWAMEIDGAPEARPLAECIRFFKNPRWK